MKTGQHLAAPTIDDRVAVCRQHLDFSLRWKGEKMGVFEMRRHYTNYFRGIPHFKPFRTRLVEEMEPKEIHAILDEVRESLTFAEVA